MKWIQYIAIAGLLLVAGCTHASTDAHLTAEISGPEGKVIRLVERRYTKRATSLLTPEGPRWNRVTASVSRYFILSGNQEVELPFLEAKDEYRPGIWSANQGLWLAHLIPVSGNTELVLFDSFGKILDRCTVRLPKGRLGGESVHFDDRGRQIVFEQEGQLYHFAIRDRRIVWLEGQNSESRK